MVVNQTYLTFIISHLLCSSLPAPPFLRRVTCIFSEHADKMRCRQVAYLFCNGIDLHIAIFEKFHRPFNPEPRDDIAHILPGNFLVPA